MSINIQYFAILREQRGLAREAYQTTAQTAGDLYDELHCKHGFTLNKALLKVSINSQFQKWDTALSDNDVVVFVPPVAGG